MIQAWRGLGSGDDRAGVGACSRRDARARVRSGIGGELCSTRFVGAVSGASCAAGDRGTIPPARHKSCITRANARAVAERGSAGERDGSWCATDRGNPRRVLSTAPLRARARGAAAEPAPELASWAGVRRGAFADRLSGLDGAGVAHAFGRSDHSGRGGPKDFATARCLFSATRSGLSDGTSRGSPRAGGRLIESGGGDRS